MSEKGEGKLGCLVIVLILFSLVYLAIKIAPVYIDRIEFEEELSRIASRAGAETWSEYFVKEQVVNSAKERQFDLRPADIEVSRGTRFQPTPRVTIRAKYKRVVEFPGYIHTFEFESEGEGLIGRL